MDGISSTPGKGYKLHITIAVVLVALTILVILLWTHYMGSEHMKSVYLDQIAMQYSQPDWFMYNGDKRDVAGLSQRDYYLENQMNASTGVEPQLFGDNRFHDHSNYMSMPIHYRPLLNPTASKMQKLSELVSNNMEEEAYIRLNKEGFM